MAIVNMTKFSLFTFDRDQSRLLERLQAFNYVHLLSPEVEESDDPTEAGSKSGRASDAAVEVHAEAEKVNYAIHLLSNYDVRPGGIKGLTEGNQTIRYDELEAKVLSSNWGETYARVKEIADRLEVLNHRETKMRTEMEEVSHWTNLDISPKALDQLNVASAMLGSVPRKISLEFEADIRKLELTSVLTVGGTKTDVWYLVLTHPKEEAALQEVLRQAAFSQMKPDYDEEPLARKQRLNKEIIELKAKQRETREELKAYASDLPKLELAYEYLENKKKRLQADERFTSTQFTKATQGFVPSDKVEEFKKSIEDAVGDLYHLELEEAQRDDPEVPIILQNNKFSRAFTDVTAMYALPKYSEVDPTPLLAPFYFLFFGMMIGDAGYGLLLLLATGYALKKMNLSRSMKGFANFFFYLSIPSIFWGVIYGSYFSLEFGAPRLLNPGEDFMTIMIMAVIFGGIHLFFGLGIKAYMLLRDGKKWDAVFDVLFWYMALTGLILMLLAPMVGLPVLVGTIAKWVMIAGMAGIVLFAARDAAGWGPRIAGGAYSLYGVSSWVGDFVSYSRLMALGLSGGFIGMAFNMMAGMVGGAWYLLPFSAVIFLVGHGFNMFLSLLSAYVHALRLTYVEFFGKFYEGGGKPFNKMKSTPKYVNYSDVESYE